MHKLHRNDVSPGNIMPEASRVVRLKAALASGNRRIDPNMVDPETAAILSNLIAIHATGSAACSSKATNGNTAELITAPEELLLKASVRCWS